MNNSPDASMKQCSTCKQSFPATFEFFFKDNSRKDGFTGRCKGCMNKYQQEHREHTLEYKKRYYQINKKELIERQKKYLQEHQEHRREYNKQTYFLNRDKIRARNKAYQQSPRGKLVDRIAHHKRRIIKTTSTHQIHVQDIADQIKRQRNRCYYCGSKFGNGRRAYHLDHVIPLSRGGSHSLDNIVIACPTCNLKKHRKLLSEWPDGGRLF